MPSKFQELLKKQRENQATCRAGLKWTSDEDEHLLKMVSENESISNMASFLQRTEGSIKTRLILYALNKMEKDNLSLEQVAELVKLQVNDITEYQRKKELKTEKRYNKQEEISNADIYNLLMSVKKILERK